MSFRSVVAVVLGGLWMCACQEETQFPEQTIPECQNYMLNLNPFLVRYVKPDAITLSCIRSRLWYENSQEIELPSDYMTPQKLNFFSNLCRCRNAYSCLSAVRNHTRSRYRRQTGGGRSQRKEIRMMTDAERQSYFRAVNQMKSDVSSGQSLYDFYVSYHVPSRSPGAHFGASFLPWHREYLKQFGISLRTYVPTIGLPYWDSTLDSYLPNPIDSVVFSSAFFGNGNGAVTTGPFANWRTTSGLPLSRNYGQGGRLFTPAVVNTVLSERNFNQLTFCVNPFYETVHGGVHTWIGGQMSSIILSPNDPIFFNYHCYIDYLWERFRQLRQTPRQRESDYPSSRDSCSIAHAANSQMLPFTIRNIDGLSNSYVTEFFEYLPSPTCTNTRECGSKYLFCDRRQGSPHCVSKVVVGGSCIGFANTDICYNSRCVNGVCVP